MWFATGNGLNRYDGNAFVVYEHRPDDPAKIAAEALRNAFRHAQAGRVEVDIRYDDGEFRLGARDDGKGIDPVVLGSKGVEGHYALRMPERPEPMGGTLACGAISVLTVDDHPLGREADHRVEGLIPPPAVCRYP
jgi:hypothetical protein